MEVPEPCNNADEEVARDLMVAYVTQSCSPEQRIEFENHYFSCDECFTKLAIITSLRSPHGDEESRALEALYPIGQESASIARVGTEMEVSTPAKTARPSLGRAVAAKLVESHPI